MKEELDNPVTKNPAELLTRSAVARILRISVNSVRRMEGTFLHPVRLGSGQKGHGSSTTSTLFDPDEVKKLTTSKIIPGRVNQRNGGAEDMNAEFDGLMAGRAFELFDQGAKLTEVVVKLQAHPAAVKAMHAEWAQLNDGIFVSAEQAKELESVSWLEGELPVRDGAHLVEILKSQNPELCSSCKRRAPGVCEACARLPRR